MQFTGRGLKINVSHIIIYYKYLQIYISAVKISALMQAIICIII